MPTRKYQLSQHFLKSPQFAGFLIGHSNIKKRDLVLEIGAGSGVITSALSKKCRLVWAVEPDPIAASKLRQNLKKRNIQNVKIFEQDFLEIDLPNESYKIFSNPPFHLSSAIMRKLIFTNLPPESIYLILQKQLALKWLNTDRHYTSKLGQEIITRYQTRIRLPLKSTDFTPPPAVPTVLYEAKIIKEIAT